MKKKVTLLTCAIIILTSVTVLCSENVLDNIAHTLEPIFELETDIEQSTELEELFEFEEIGSAEEIALFSTTAQTYIDELESYVATNDFENTDAERIKYKFISTMADFQMTTPEVRYINALIVEDYDVEKILDIYTFIRWTDADISMIEEIYLTGEKNSDEKFWIYDAYDTILNRVDDMLTVEDVAYYVASGISIDEITGAYELSFAGVKTTKQMLAERMSGETWNSIAASVVSSNPSVIENAPEMDIREILKYKNYATMVRKDVSDILTINNNAITLKASIVDSLNVARDTKNLLFDTYDVHLQKDETEINIYDYSDNDVSAFAIDTDEYLTEDDLIPLEEPEVE